MAIVWTLAAHLEVLPAILDIFFRKAGVAQLVLLVVLGEEIFNDGTRLRSSALDLDYFQHHVMCTYLPKGHPNVWVMNRWKPAVRIYVGIWLLLDICHVYVFRLIREIKLVEEDQDLGRIWTLHNGWSNYLFVHFLAFGKYLHHGGNRSEWV